MTRREVVQAIVFAAIDDLNATRPPELRLRKEPQTALAGGAPAMDSLDLVTLLHTIESAIAEQLGIEVHLTESPSVFDPGGPLTQVGLLIDHLATITG
jgi:hypothetical protein